MREGRSSGDAAVCTLPFGAGDLVNLIWEARSEGSVPGRLASSTLSVSSVDGLGERVESERDIWCPGTVSWPVDGCEMLF